MRLTGCLLTILCAVAMVPVAHGSETDVAARGKAIAEEHCARCHAIGKEGESPHKEAPAFRTFAARWPLENLEEALAEGIVTGHPDMPAVVLEPDEIDAFLEYLHSLNPDGDGGKTKE